MCKKKKKCINNKENLFFFVLYVYIFFFYKHLMYKHNDMNFCDRIVYIIRESLRAAGI